MKCKPNLMIPDATPRGRLAPDAGALRWPVPRVRGQGDGSAPGVGWHATPRGGAAAPDADVASEHDETRPGAHERCADDLERRARFRLRRPGRRRTRRVRAHL